MFDLFFDLTLSDSKRLKKMCIEIFSFLLMEIFLFPNYFHLISLSRLTGLFSYEIILQYANDVPQE